MSTQKKNYYDAVIIPGGGNRQDGIPTWVEARFDKAVEYEWKYALALSAGTVHRPNPVDKDGFPILESVAGARYMMTKHGITPERLLVDTGSFDTIGNAYFAKFLFADPFQWKKLLVVTSEHHMPRTRAIFTWIFHECSCQADDESPKIHLDFATSPDQGMDNETLEARGKREAQSLKYFNENTRKNISSVTELATFLFVDHGAYNMKPAVKETGKALQSY